MKSDFTPQSYCTRKTRALATAFRATKIGICPTGISQFQHNRFWVPTNKKPVNAGLSQMDHQLKEKNGLQFYMKHEKALVSLRK
jgi:hypothetical protein